MKLKSIGSKPCQLQHRESIDIVVEDMTADACACHSTLSLILLSSNPIQTAYYCLEAKNWMKLMPSTDSQNSLQLPRVGGCCREKLTWISFLFCIRCIRYDSRDFHMNGHLRHSRSFRKAAARLEHVMSRGRDP